MTSPPHASRRNPHVSARHHDVEPATARGQPPPRRSSESHCGSTPSGSSYEARQRRLRAGAWISTGVAVAGLAGAIALQASASSLYGNESTPGTFLYDRARLQSGVTTEGGVDLRAQASSLQSDIHTRETWSYVSLGVGAVAAVAATWFWIAGEDPDRYAGFAEPVARVGVVPLRGGAVAAVTVGF